MDVERTIGYILQMQAKAEVRMAKADERMDKFDNVWRRPASWWKPA